MSTPYSQLLSLLDLYNTQCSSVNLSQSLFCLKSIYSVLAFSEYCWFEICVYLNSLNKISRPGNTL